MSFLIIKNISNVWTLATINFYLFCVGMIYFDVACVLYYNVQAQVIFLIIFKEVLLWICLEC